MKGNNLQLLKNQFKDLSFDQLVTGGAWMTRVMANMAMNRSVKLDAKSDCAAWDEEKDDILERASWLCDKVIVAPRQLIESMPSMLGPHFANEWAIYSCSHLMAALANIARLYPEQKSLCLERMERIVPIVLAPEMRYYDTTTWHEDALASLEGDNHHMTYLSILAWCISLFRLTGGHDGHDQMYHKCCEALHRRMLKSDDLNLLSFPGNPVFLPDMMFTIVALKNYETLCDNRYAATVAEWLSRARTVWIDHNTGLLRAMLPADSRRKSVAAVRGSYTGLNCYCLTMLDPDFARQQHEQMKQVLLSVVNEGIAHNIVGIREYLDRSPKMYFDPDAGPIAFGLSPSGTAWAIGSATYFEDWDLRYQLLRTAEIAGSTVKQRGKRHYRLGELAPVGEAVALAAKTNLAQAERKPS